MKKLLTLCCIAASLLVVGCNRTADKGGADGSELYGYVNIRLPHIEGMHECHTHPRVMAFTERYRQSGPILGYYLDDATYPRVDSLGQITFDNYFMIYGDYNRENYDATPADLPLNSSAAWSAPTGKSRADARKTPITRSWSVSPPSSRSIARRKVS